MQVYKEALSEDATVLSCTQLSPQKEAVEQENSTPLYTMYLMNEEHFQKPTKNGCVLMGNSNEVNKKNKVLLLLAAHGHHNNM